jgi:hypothetical protein
LRGIWYEKFWQDFGQGVRNALYLTQAAQKLLILHELPAQPKHVNPELLHQFLKLCVWNVPICCGNKKWADRGIELVEMVLQILYLGCWYASNRFIAAGK